VSSPPVMTSTTTRLVSKFFTISCSLYSQDPRVVLEIIAFRRPSGAHETVGPARQLGTMFRSSANMIIMFGNKAKLVIKVPDQWTEDSGLYNLVQDDVRIDLFISPSHPIFQSAALRPLLKNRTYSVMGTRSNRQDFGEGELVRITDARRLVRVVVYWGIAAPGRHGNCLFLCRARFNQESFLIGASQLLCDFCNKAIGSELAVCPLCARWGCGKCGAPFKFLGAALRDLDTHWSVFSVIRRNAPWFVEFAMRGLELRDTTEAVKEIMAAGDLAPRPHKYTTPAPTARPAMARLLAQEPCRELVESRWALDADFRCVPDALHVLRFAAGGNRRTDLRVRLSTFMMGTRRATASPVRLLPQDLVAMICEAVAADNGQSL